MRTYQWAVTALAVLVAVLATLLITGVVSNSPDRCVMAQTTASGGFMIGLTGAETSNRMPVVLVDTKQQVILAYEYNYSRRSIILAAVRPYRYDLDFWMTEKDQSYNLGSGTSRGVSVSDVRKKLERIRRRP